MFYVNAHINRQSFKTRFTILENITEWEKFAAESGATLKTLFNCKADDWIMSDNGYYMQVIKTWHHETPKMILKTIEAM